jgi:bacterioferritin-associated ferredoxin
MFLCTCRAVSDTKVRELGRNGITAPNALVEALGLADPECCGRCIKSIKRFVTVAEAGSGATQAVGCPL